VTNSDQPHDWRAELRLRLREIHPIGEGVDEVIEELAQHLESAEHDLRERGEPADSIRTKLRNEIQYDELRSLIERNARLRQPKRPLRDASGVRWMDRLLQDTRYAIRGLRRSPAFTLTVVLTFALGAGANAAMFSFLDRVFFRDPPGLTKPAELRRVYYFEKDPFGGDGDTRALARFGYPEFAAFRDAIAGSVAADIAPSALASGPRGDTLPQTSYVTSNYLSVLGVRLAAGRSFTEEEARMDMDARVAIITHAYWKRAYGLDPGVLGKRITAYGKEYTIVGVTAEGFAGIDVRALEMMLPLRAYPAAPRNGKPWYEDNDTWSPVRVIARAPVGTSDEALLTNATRLYRENMRSFRARDTTIRLISGPIIAANGPERNSKEVTLSARLGGVTLAVMLIACANIASLLLVRATRRRREVAMRLALGVSRRRLSVQLLTESLLLSAAGGVLAIGVAFVAGTALRKLLLPTNVWAGGVVNMRVVMFTLLTTTVVGIAAGLAPVLQSLRTDLTDTLKSGGHGSTTHGHLGRAGLLALQGAVSLVLLVAAGLFIRTRDAVRTMPLGFDQNRLIYLTTNTPDSLAGRVGLALQQAADLMAQLPGVRAAAITSDVPMATNRSGFASLPDRPGRLPAYGNGVAADFFAATGMTFVAGRAFTREEAESQAPVLVVNAALAQTAWPNESAIGKCVLIGLNTKNCYTVVGVTANARNFELFERRTSQAYYAPLSATLGSFYRPRAVVINADPAVAPDVMKRANEELSRLLLGVGTVRARRTSEQLVDQYRPWELGAKLFTAFGMLALVVAAVGIYSVVAYTVNQRTKEMGVRMALGAQLRDVLDLVVAGGMKVVGIGIAGGVVVALFAGKLIESQLFGVTARDPYVLIGAASVLGAVALVACMIPAWRAARVNPVEALRTE
jgi:predicted permease